MKIDKTHTLALISNKTSSFWELASSKVFILEKGYDPSKGSPVYTVDGRYTTRGWTEWTQGFQYGIPLLLFKATGDRALLDIGRSHTLSGMSHHLSHFGVHDHGFNNLSTYGNLLSSANLGQFICTREEKDLYRLALKLSGAVQAKRWTPLKDGGYIYSFNGPHSLFIDTMRTIRIMLVSHMLGHRMMEEGDEVVDLFERALLHGLTTAKYSVYYGEERDEYDICGRTAHESIFNINDGQYRCPNSQQGFSGFTTWTRGLSWAMLGFAEQLEFLDIHSDGSELAKHSMEVFLKAAKATCDFYIRNTASDGIPYWDTGAPDLYRLGDYRDKPAEPFNDFEPVDSSAAAIGAQGLLRLSRYLQVREPEISDYYLYAGLTVLNTLLSPTYLSMNKAHEGILLHSVYHRPNGWDHVPSGRRIPCGESSMWGDYHMVELCYMVKTMLKGPFYTFFSQLNE
jgi:unsaturated chondroitin disaccharide hydrolase